MTSNFPMCKQHRKKKEKEDKKPAMASKTTPPKEAETDIVIINTGDIDRIKVHDLINQDQCCLISKPSYDYEDQNTPGPFPKSSHIVDV